MMMMKQTRGRTLDRARRETSILTRRARSFARSFFHSAVLKIAHLRARKHGQFSARNEWIPPPHEAPSREFT